VRSLARLGAGASGRSRVQDPVFAPLFRLHLPSNVGFYDVTADGQRFLVSRATPLQQSAPLMVITDWRAQLREPGGTTR